MKFDGEILSLRDRLMQHRRYLHRYPETDFEVARTRDYIVNRVKELGFEEISILAKNGVKAVMRRVSPAKPLPLGPIWTDCRLRKKQV